MCISFINAFDNKTIQNSICKLPLYILLFNIINLSYHKSYPITLFCAYARKKHQEIYVSFQALHVHNLIFFLFWKIKFTIMNSILSSKRKICEIFRCIPRASKTAINTGTSWFIVRNLASFSRYFMHKLSTLEWIYKLNIS